MQQKGQCGYVTIAHKMPSSAKGQYTMLCHVDGIAEPGYITYISRLNVVLPPLVNHNNLYSQSSLGKQECVFCECHFTHTLKACFS